MKLLLFALLVAVCLESIQAASTHLRAPNMPLVHPFKIICSADKSVSILQNTSYNLDLFVAGNVPSCPYHNKHFTIDNQNVNLTSSCMDTKERAFLIEAQNRPVSPTTSPKPFVMGGKNSVVYRVTCIPDTDGDPVSVSIMPPVSIQATASQLVLPSLKIGIFAASTVPVNEPKKPETSLTLGSEAQLVIYNDRSGNTMPYMLIPSQCDAHPDKLQTPMLTLLKDDNNNNNNNNNKPYKYVSQYNISIDSTMEVIQTNKGGFKLDLDGCTHEEKMPSTFKVTNTTNYDLAYATLYPFKFEGYAGTPVVLECTVYICPKDDTVDGVRNGYCAKQSLNSGTNRCSQVSPTSDYTKKRRRRDVGVGDSGVERATLRATFSVQEPLMSGASMCSTGIWALVALVYIFK